MGSTCSHEGIEVSASFTTEIKNHSNKSIWVIVKKNGSRQWDWEIPSGKSEREKSDIDGVCRQGAKWTAECYADSEFKHITCEFQIQGWTNWLGVPEVIVTCHARQSEAQMLADDDAVAQSISSLSLGSDGREGVRTKVSGRPGTLPQHGRFNDVDGNSPYQGKLRLPKGYIPPLDCKSSLLASADELKLEELEDVVEDLDIRMSELVSSGVCAQGSPDYERRYSLLAYTYEANFLERHQQLYFVLNADLRSRSNGRFKLWMNFMYYLLAALQTIPDTAATVYKGMRELPTSWVVDGSAKIHWSGFSSTSTDEQVSRTFAEKGGIVLKIKVFNAKDVQPYSWFGESEKELMLSPNMEFVVTKTMYQQDGINYLDLQQVPNTTVWS